MKVLYLLRYFPTLTETFVYREIDEIGQVGVQPLIASLGRRADGALQDELPRAEVLHVPRHPLTGRLSPASPGQRWLARQQRPSDAARLPWLRARLDGVDRLHVHFAGGAAEWAHALSMDTGLPYSVTVHAVDLFRPQPSLVEVLGGADRVFTVAEHHRSLLAARGVPSLLLRCGPDLQTWAMPPPDPGPLRALAVGRNVPKKGFDLLLEAWRGLERPEARLCIVSDLADPGLPGVEVRPLMSPARLRQEMAVANLVVLPCRRAADGDMDGVPVSLMEGLAAGRAVMSTRVSGVPELVDPEVGWLLPPEDTLALRQALREAHDRPEERLRRGTAGPARLAQRGFTVQEQARTLLRGWTDATG